jgi:hypothetical protein
MIASSVYPDMMSTRRRRALDNELLRENATVLARHDHVGHQQLNVP